MKTEQRSHLHPTSLNIFRLVCISICLAVCLAACASETPPVSSSATSSAYRPYDARLESLVVDGTKANAREIEQLSAIHASYTSKVQAEYQYPEMPSGCEVISLTIALRSYGFTLEKTTIADDYLVIDGSEWGFLASPYQENGGGFPPGIVTAANSYLQDQGVSLTAHNLTGSSFESVQALVDAGIPVLVWTTLALNEPNYDASLGATDTWFVNEHCVVLYGQEQDSLLVANPLEGLVSADAVQFAHVYKQCGSMSVAIW